MSLSSGADLRNSVVGVAAIMFGVLPAQSQALCTIHQNYSTHTTRIDWKGGAVVVPRNAPVGVPIAEQEFVMYAQDVQMANCPDGGGYYYDIHQPSAGYRHTILQSGLSGIGLRFSEINREGKSTYWYPRSEFYDDPYGIWAYAVTTLKVEVVRISEEVESGRVNSGLYVSRRLDSGVEIFRGEVGTIEIQTGNCSIVPHHGGLGSRKGADFKEIGSTVGSAVWGYRLECPAGVAKVTLAFEPMHGFVKDGADGLIKIDPSVGAARGVAIQLWEKTAAMDLRERKEYSRPGEGSNWTVDVNDLEARYYKTENQVSSGRADSALYINAIYE